MPSAETTYYSDDEGVRVTNRRVIIDGTTYVLDNITSTRVDSFTPSVPGGFVGNALVFVVVWILAVAGGLSVGGGFALSSLLVAPFVLYHKRRKYTLRVGSASGRSDALEDRGRERLDRVSRAINEAIIGEPPQRESHHPNTSRPPAQERHKSQPRSSERRAPSSPDSNQSSRIGRPASSRDGLFPVLGRALGLTWKSFAKGYYSLKRRLAGRSWAKAAVLGGAFVVFSAVALSTPLPSKLATAFVPASESAKPVLYVTTYFGGSNGLPDATGHALDRSTEAILRRSGFIVPDSLWSSSDKKHPHLEARYHTDRNFFASDEVTIDLRLIEPATTSSGSTGFVTTWSTERTIQVRDFGSESVRPALLRELRSLTRKAALQSK